MLLVVPGVYVERGHDFRIISKENPPLIQYCPESIMINDYSLSYLYYTAIILYCHGGKFSGQIPF
jgi:hypothetical protein